MNLSKRQSTIFLLVLVFLVSFLIIFLPIILTQSAYSTPNSYSSIINGMAITLGPPPNSTNIALDTKIIVDALASASLDDLHASPEVNFASVSSETTGPLTYQTTFYPDKPLDPATTYTISVTIMETAVSWSFTTTTESFHPGTSYYLSTNGLWIALGVAASATIIIGFASWFKRKQKAKLISNNTREKNGDFKLF